MAEFPSSLKDIELLILDMDGVVTSEAAYWDVAGLVVRDLLESPAFMSLSPPDYTPIADLFYQRLNRGSRSDWRKYLPPELIKHCKSRGMNSNWDLAYLVAGIYIAPLFSPFSTLYQALTRNNEEPAGDNSNSDESFFLQLQDTLEPVWDRLHQCAQKNQWADFLHLNDFYLWGEWFRQRKSAVTPVNKVELRIMDDFHPDVRGVRLLDELNKLIDRDPEFRHPLFGRQTPLWEECRDLFQQWYLGEDLYEKTYGYTMAYKPKPGLIHHEEPLHGLEKTHSCLFRLREKGYRLGIATGRPRMEIFTPLKEWGALHYFQREHICTHDEVESAEKELRQQGIQEPLGKPHPYCFMRAIRPGHSAFDIYQQCNSPLPDRNKILIVGDAMADIWAAKKIDCPCVGLLSGAMGETGRRILESASPDFICRDIVELTDVLVSKSR